MQGHLRLSLVTCPVALYPATSEADTVRFNPIDPQTNNRIKMKTVDAGTGNEVWRSKDTRPIASALISPLFLRTSIGFVT